MSTDETFVTELLEIHAKGDISAERAYIKTNGGMDRIYALAKRGVTRAKSETRKKGERIPDGFPDQAAKDRAIAHWDSVGRPDLSGSIDSECLRFRSWVDDQDLKRPRWGATWGNWYRNTPGQIRPAGKLALVEATPANVPAASLATWLLRLEMFYGKVEDNPAGTWSPANGPNPDDPRNAVPVPAWSAYRAECGQGALALPEPRREA